MQNILAIPQVQDCLSHALTKSDLIALSLVCKQWNATFARYIWRDMSRRRSFSVQGLIRHGHHVKYLDIREPSEISVFAPYCHQLLSLSVELKGSIPAEYFSALWNFSEVNSRTLQELTLSFVGLEHWPAKSINMPHLSRLWLVCDRLSCHQVAMFLDGCPCLQSLCISVEHPIELVREAFQRDEYRLEQLNYEPSHLDLTLFLWQKCPRLNDFIVPFFDNHLHLQQVQQVLSTHPSKKRTLDFVQRSPSEEMLVALVEACPAGTLSRMFIEQAAVTDALWSTLLQRQMDSLSFLDLSSSTLALPKGSVQKVLCLCRTLQYFDAIPIQLPSDVAPEDLGMVEATNAVAVPWVCLDIKVLRFVIVGICGKDTVQCEHHGDWCEKTEQALLAQLQRLRKLQHLGISHARKAVGPALSHKNTWPMRHIDSLKHLQRIEIWSTSGRHLLAIQTL